VNECALAWVIGRAEGEKIKFFGNSDCSDMQKSTKLIRWLIYAYQKNDSAMKNNRIGD
jgi:hypothetical protein